jgi:hypothetical protein
MPRFVLQVAYSAASWNAIVSKPRDGIEAVCSFDPPSASWAERVVSGWFPFGQYDLVPITEMPDHVGAAPVVMSFAGGAGKSMQTNPVLTEQEAAMRAMKQAAECGYRPATVLGRAAQVSWTAQVSARPPKQGRVKSSIAKVRPTCSRE